MSSPWWVRESYGRKEAWILGQGPSGGFWNFHNRQSPQHHTRETGFLTGLFPAAWLFCFNSHLSPSSSHLIWLLLPSGSVALNLPKRVPGLAPSTSLTTKLLGWKAGGSLASVTCTSTMALAAVFLLGCCSSPASQGTSSSSFSTAMTRLHAGCVS